jgi:hypothetical protein
MSTAGGKGTKKESTAARILGSGKLS